MINLKHFLCQYKRNLYLNLKSVFYIVVAQRTLFVLFKKKLIMAYNVF